jgi:hypothetical protein
MIARKLLLGAFAAAVVSTAALAQTTVIEERSRPSVTVTEQPSVTIEKRVEEPRVRVEKRIETTGSADCRTKTVHKEDAAGSTTIRKDTCD